MPATTTPRTRAKAAKRTRCTYPDCKRLAPKGRKRCEDHKPGARPPSAGPAPRKTPLLGSTEARQFTKPLRQLTRETSRGYEVVDFARMIGEPLLPWQEWAVIHGLELNPDGSFRFRTILIVVARQNGKALDAGTEILTSRGFVTMRDIRAGDEVFHPAGHLTRVAAVSEVVNNHDCYRVTTTDGRSIIADRDHLWTVRDMRHYKSKGPRGNVVRTYPMITMTTAELLAAGISRCKSGSRTTVTAGKRYASQEYRFQLPVQEPLKSPDVPLPIDPYVLGAWLGDGDTASAGFTSADPEIIEQIRGAGEPVIKAPHGPHRWRLSDGSRSHSGRTAAAQATMQARLRQAGVLGSKHVPDAYLTAGTAQREALLQGLMDTDGTIEPARGQVEFCSTLLPLAEAVLFLARSLGWRATLRTGRATFRGKDCGPKYRVFFTPKATDPFRPFRLPRKAARIGAADGGRGRATVSIASIEPVESRPVRCIRVESPDGLYLAGRDLIPTHNSALMRTISLWRMYVDNASRIIGLAQDVALARDQWNMCQETIHGCPDLEDEWGRVRNVNGDEWFEASGCRYGIKAANRRAGRGGSNDQVNIDELREQQDWKAWAAAAKTTMARRNGLVLAGSNAGDDTSVVLNQLQDIGEAGTDPSLCILEWSAPKGCELDDEQAWCQANPGLGYIISEQAIRSSMLTDPPNVFRTEVLCQRVDVIDSAIDIVGWQACKDSQGTMSGLRDRIAAVLEVSENGEHATLAVAARTADGRPRIEIVRAWDSAVAARAGITAELAKVKPAAFCWFPGGPAAEMATVLRPLAMHYNKRPGKRQPGDPPENGEISGQRVTEVCQELAGLVRGRAVIQPGDPLLDSHIRGAAKLMSGDGWRFTRKNGNVDAAYAAAGAVSIALAMPEPKRARVRVLAG